jgi:hypothetical protein
VRQLAAAVFSICGIACDADDDRSHGQDERILVDSYYQSLDFTYRLLKSL